METIAPALKSHHLTWRGTCGNHAAMTALFQALRTISNRSVQLRQGSATYGADVLARLLAGQAGELSSGIREYGHAIAGRIHVAGDVLGEKEADFEVTELALRGLDFELYAPNTGNGGRMSFVMITQAADSRLVGRLVAIQAGEGGNADWWVTLPTLTHSAGQSEWLDLLLGWVRFFHLTKLEIERDGVCAHDSLLEIMFADAVRQAGESTARRVALQWLLDEYEIQAESWGTDESSWN